MNIYSDAAFQLANNALDARLKELKRNGESRPAQHKAVITPGDMEKLARYFSGSTSAVVLAESVRFAITYHIALRGCENQEFMKKTDLEIKVDENGHEFVELATSFTTKKPSRRCEWPRESQ